MRLRPLFLSAATCAYACAQTDGAPFVDEFAQMDSGDPTPRDAASPAETADAAGHGSLDASSVDAALPVAIVDAATSAALTVYPRMGAAADDVTVPAGPGLVIDGGTMITAGLTWARTTLGADLSTRAFDAVILAAVPGDQSASLYNAAPFGSVQTLALGPGATANDFAAAAAIVARAELVFFPGGEQSGYAVWAGSALAKSVQAVHDRGGVIAGTSAGSLMLGAFAFDALDAGGISENVTPSLAIGNPYDPEISFTRHMFAFAPLADAITEVHFEQRDRMGRVAMFMARQQADGVVARKPPFVLGIAVDEHAAVVIDAAGNGKLLQDDPSGRAFLIKGGPPDNCTPNERLVYSGLEVHRLDDPSQTFDFNRWCGTAPVYTLDLSADPSTPFGPESPYDRDAAASACP